MILKDHPRLRGEKSCVLLSVFLSLGSPPLTRGKVSTAIRTYGDLGITPAYAGKRYLNQMRWCSYEDHPRLRGEKLILFPVAV